ncbi:MAG: M12 family metallo-peptidase [Granulosicoccaceae bacterium]
MVAGLLLGATQVSAADLDFLYRQGLAFERSGQYAQALESYKVYLQQASVADAHYERVKYKLPVLNESKTHAPSEDTELYLNALDARADGDSDDALFALDSLIDSFPDSYLLDDALYLRGYIYTMDRFEFDKAQQSLAELRRRIPDSSYIDASLYIDAIVLEQQGHTAQAKAQFEELRDKHASFSIDLLGFSLPRNTYQSRLWFDRADQRIKALEDQELVSTKIVSQSMLSGVGYERRVTLTIAGEEVTVLLNPALVTINTNFLDQDGKLFDASGIQVFDGVVENESNSWVRAVFNGDSVQGLISRAGVRYDLKTDTVTGTMVNYNPSLQLDHSDEDREDTVVPPTVSAGLTPAADETESIYQQLPVTRVAPISTVLDSQFNAYNSGRGLFEALTVLAIADGIYREELGIALRLDTLVNIEDRDSDPMNIGSVTMDTMLSNFRDYRRSATPLDESSSAYVYLFSGNASSDNQVGLAYIGVACRNDGYDVSVSTPYQRNYLLAAHEMAHNLGAKHDIDTSCQADRTKIMAPYFTQDTQHRFSSCSKAAITQRVTASCFEDAIDLQALMTSVSDDTVGAAIRNNDLTRPTTAALEVKVEDAELLDVPSNCDVREDGTLNCDLGMLAAGEVKVLEIDTKHNSDNSRRAIVQAHVGEKTSDVVVANNSQTVSFEQGEHLEWPLDSGYVKPGTGATTSSSGGGGSTGLEIISGLFAFIALSVVFLRRQRQH